MWNRFGGACFYCGAEATTIDHAIPLVRGGTNAIGNLLPACRMCNTRKSTKTITEFRLYLQKMPDTHRNVRSAAATAGMSVRAFLGFPTR
jgi:5-methylcytosine-specific restriction endonuclease McrA